VRIRPRRRRHNSSIVQSLPSSSRISESAARHFPTDGRAATMIMSLGCSPEVIMSRSVKPVGIPVTVPLSRYRLSIFSKLSLRISLMV
jgi:hypothetical protein